MELTLDLRFKGVSIASGVRGENVAELMMQIPETTNAMLRYLNEELEKRERKTGQEIAVVRTDAGGADAPATGGREGRLLPPAGV